MISMEEAVFPVAIAAVGLDRRSQHLVDAAVQLAQPMGFRQLHLVHVHPVTHMPAPVLGGLPAGSVAPAASERLGALVEAVSARLAGIEVQGHDAAGRVSAEVLRVAQQVDADIVLLGRRTSKDRGRAWGGDGVEILRHAGRTALVVPECSSPDLSRIVVGFDFSSDSTAAMKVAVALGGKVRAVFAYRVDPGVAFGGISPEEFAEQVELNARLHFREEILPELPEGAARPGIEILSAREPTEALVELGESAGLIVIGSRGLGPLAARLLGSTTEAVAGVANVPVLAVRNKGEDLGLIEALLHR